MIGRIAGVSLALALTALPAQADPRPVAVEIGAGEGTGQVLLVRFQRERTTDVGAGENAGRTARDANGVRSLATLGPWDGARRQFAIEPPAADEGIAILVQAPDGKMLGAAMMLGPG